MPIDAAKKSQIRDLIAVSRKNPVNFGLCFAKILADSALILHKTKNLAALATQAKTEGGGPKAVSGELKTEEKVISLVCAVAPPNGTARRLQEYLRLLGLRFTVMIVDPDGVILELAADPETGDEENEEESDLDDPTDEDPGQSTDQQADPEAMKEALRGFLQTLPGDLKRLEGGDATALAAAKALYAEGIAAAKAGDLARALQALDSCATEVGRLQSKASRGEAADAIPEGLVADAVRRIEISAALWRAGRMQSIEGLVALIQSLRKEDDPELHEIGERIKVLTQKIPASLEAALKELEATVTAGDPGAVSGAKAKVMGELQDAAAYLKTNAEALHTCEDNPWEIKISIVKPLADAIRQIQADVSAV